MLVNIFLSKNMKKMLKNAILLQNKMTKAHPEGMPESSRRLSEAIPPVSRLNSRTPKGCQKQTRKNIFWHPFGVQNP